jgi:hypothetical protein
MTNKFKYDVFLSHNSQDKSFVEVLASKLVDEAGINPFLDKWHLIPGMPWQESLEQALEDSKTVLLCYGSSGLAPWHSEEIRSSIKLLMDDERRVIPVLLPGANFPQQGNLPSYLRRLTWVDYRGGLSDDEAFLRVVTGIKGKPPGRIKRIDAEPEVDGLPRIGKLLPGWRIPYAPNPAFIGRESDFRALASVLLEGRSPVAITQAVQGLGGIGKTQLAVEFCYRYGKFFKGVHWISASNPDAFLSEIAACGAEMDIQPWPEDIQAQVVLTLNEWRRFGPRLVVLDGLDDEITGQKMIEKISEGGDVRILITTRRRLWPPELVNSTISLGVFSRYESIALLRKYLTENTYSDNDMDILAAELGDLPLALELAGRYLATTKIKVMDYIQRISEASHIEQSSLNKWKPKIGSPTNHDFGLLNTFLTSWDLIDDPNAKSVFLLSSWCAPNNVIPTFLLAEASNLEVDELEKILTFLDLTALIGYEGIEEGIVFHPLFSSFGRLLDDENNKQHLEIISETLSEIGYTFLNSGLPQNFAVIKPHVEEIIGFADHIPPLIITQLFNFLGYYYEMIGEYFSSKQNYEQALAINQEILGADHPDTARSLNNLGAILRAVGDYETARAYYEQALAINQKVLGADHPDTARSLNNLGAILKATGDYETARAYYLIFAHTDRISIQRQKMDAHRGGF